MMFVYFIATFIALLSLLSTFKNQQLVITITAVHLALIPFIASQVVSTYLSIDPHTSLWGYYSRFHGGLISTLVYVFIFSIITNQLQTSETRPYRDNFLLTMFCACILVCIYGVAQHFGIDAEIWKQDVQHRIFSTLGQPNWLAAYVVICMPVSWYLFFRHWNNTPRNIPFCILSLTSNALVYLALIYTRSRSGYLGFITAFIVFIALLIIRHLRVKTPSTPSPFVGILLLTALYLVISGISSTPFTPSLQEINRPETKIEVAQDPNLLISDSGDIRRIVWEGAFKLGTAYPVTGTGVETFAYSYYWTRPREHNDVSEWDFLYNKAHNEYLNFFANSGLLGLGTYLVLIATPIVLFIRAFIKTPQNVTLAHISLFAGWLSIHITNFFGFSVVIVGLFTFILPALFLYQLQPSQVLRISLSRIPRPIGICITIVLVLILLSTFAKIFYADLHYAFARKLNNQNHLSQAYQLIETAIDLNPTEFTYHNYAIGVSADLASQLVLNNEATAAAAVATSAITSADATILLNPYHINSWKDRAAGLITLTTLSSDYIQYAISSLEFARALAPTDPKITYNLALLYARQPDYPKSIQLLRHTLLLKPDYHDAKFALASYLHQTSIASDKQIIDLQQHQQAIQYLEEYLSITGGSPYKNTLIDQWRKEATAQAKK